MATLALQIAGTALGTFIGGPFGGALGSALGGVFGSMVDRAVLGGGGRTIEGPRLNDLRGISASEGAAIPRLYGRAKLGGQVIWATEFEEERIVEKNGGSGKSTGASAGRTVRYTYFANVAIGLCEGPVSFIRRIWADGEELDLASLNFRIYTGDEAQEPDPLIIAKQETGEIPAFRGLAYVVFERLPLASYGNRLPQFAFEVVRAAPGLPDGLRAINLIPGSTEFGYAKTEVRESFGLGASQTINRAQWTHETDWAASVDALQALAPNLERATLISAWFGNDLRAGHCTLRPRTEKAGKATTGATWSVAGLVRSTAEPVSDTDGRPNFGGSPSDGSIIEAIRDLKARGLDVALHPFILMDIPPGNALPDPWNGSASQPAFPWRGRITCDPAPGQPASPEGTATVNAQIAAFVGSAQAAHFSLAGDTILYSGPNEWSFRRMVLHHAMLAKAAGGVETFILGSEMIGLSHCAAASGQFPFVAALVGLLPDLRTILGPATVITYAADWTEYGARVRNNGQEIRFPLDPFWAHAEVGAIGIDFYAPLTDWRGGRDHADAGLFGGGLDPDYLASRITGGEAFDWYYADDPARAQQIRSPITDGAYAKPWIYRPKDLKSWWQEPHVERSGGIELAQPTAFLPEGKPIYLTEIGCPAVDKGANQPNVFPDPKSVENALPHFSTGGRDDLAQWRVLEAILGYFNPAAAGFVEENNPVSSHYGGRMIWTGFIAPWAFDARPYPAFPLQRSLWADGENWLRGHWLNGRLEAVPVDRLLAMIMADFGLPAPEVRGVDALIDGYVIERPMSPRAAIEPIATLFGLSARPEGETILFRGRATGASRRIAEADIVPAQDGVLVEIVRQQDSDLPRQISLGFVDDENGFRQAVATAETAVVNSRRETKEAAAIHLPRGAARRLAETRLQDIWSGRETFQFRLTRDDLALEPGDLIELETRSGLRLALLTAITDGPHRACEARAYDLLFSEPGPTIDELPEEPGVPALPGAAHVSLLELPLDRGAGLLSAAVRADPWRGPYSATRTDDGITRQAIAIDASARIGTTMTVLPAGPLWRWDHQSAVEVTLEDGALSSLSDLAVLGGANALALQAPTGEIEIILFRQAELVGARRYRLSGLLRGIGCSEAAAARQLAAGATAFVLDDALTDLGVGIDAIGIQRTFVLLPAGRDLGDPTAVEKSAVVSGVALKPLAPVHVHGRREVGGIRFSFVRRARTGGDSFDLFEVPLGEDREEYRFEILNGASVVRVFTLVNPEVLYASAHELADFGAAQGTVRIRVRQISQQVGPGDALETPVAIG
jgi:hypothetical protein